MKVLMGSVAALVLLLVAGVAYMGVLGPIDVNRVEAGPYHFVYVLSNTQDIDHLERLTAELDQKLQAAGYEQREPAKMFFPAGCGNEPQELSSCQSATSQIGFVTERAVAVSALGALEYFRTIPPDRYLEARFPYRNGLSYAIGSWRVEGKLEEQRAARKYRKRTSTMVLEKDGQLVYLQPAVPI